MIYLERRDPKKNLYRFYRLSLEKNLFGEWSLMREWGRLGYSGHEKLDLYDTLDAAQEALSKKLQEKRRRGYQ
jgi:predicted DNA-binding WGR domain protein